MIIIVIFAFIHSHDVYQNVCQILFCSQWTELSEHCLKFLMQCLAEGLHQFNEINNSGPLSK